MAYALLVAEVAAERRAQLDADLGVAGWPTPGAARHRPALAAAGPVAATPDGDGAPPAWYGTSEEEVSQAFLAEMGIELD